MKKIILALLAPLAIFSFAVILGVSKAQAQMATVTCPVGYTCTSISNVNLPLTVSIIGTPMSQISGFTSTGVVQSTSTLSKTYHLSMQAGDSDVYIDYGNSAKPSFSLSSSSVMVLKDGAGIIKWAYEHVGRWYFKRRSSSNFVSDVFAISGIIADKVNESNYRSRAKIDVKTIEKMMHRINEKYPNKFNIAMLTSMAAHLALNRPDRVRVRVGSGLAADHDGRGVVDQ